MSDNQPSNEPTPFTRIQQGLQARDFKTRLLPVSAGNQVERLFVIFGRDEQNRDYVLQLMFINDMLNIAGQRDQPGDAYLLQFALEFPFRVGEKELFSDLARLLLTMNRILPSGALGLDETAHTVNFNYVLVCEDRAADDDVVAGITEMAMFFLHAFAPLIETVGNGSCSREQAIAQLQQLDLTVPPLPNQGDGSYRAVIRV
jgi:hypothetical protein